MAAYMNACALIQEPGSEMSQVIAKNVLMNKERRKLSCFHVQYGRYGTIHPRVSRNALLLSPGDILLQSGCGDWPHALSGSVPAALSL